MYATCSKCGTEWAGELICHCSVCHLTFTSHRGFDEHRQRGKCLTKEALLERGLSPNRRGQWRRPRPDTSLPLAIAISAVQL